MGRILRAAALAFVVVAFPCVSYAQSKPPTPSIPSILVLPTTTFSTHCRIYANARHAFTQADLEKLAADPAVKAIIARGTVRHSEAFEIRSSALEYVPVFVTESRAIAGISWESLKKVFIGQITDWSQVGSDTGRIRLYLHGGELQKRALEAFLMKEGLKTDAMAHVPTTFHPSYGELAAHAAGDRNSLTVGLRELSPQGLKPVPVDGSPISLEASHNYPLQMPVKILIRKGALSEREVSDLIEEVRRTR